MSSITVIVQYLLTKFRLSIFLTGPGSTSKLVPGFASRDPKDLPAVESLGGGGARIIPVRGKMLCFMGS